MNRQTYLAPGAHVVGDVTLGENVGIWYNAVVRGDTGSIFIDDNSNVQDNSTLHTDEGHSIHIGKGVSIGHNAVVHGAIHQENGGHGEAVNAGIRNATGLFFKVVDSDDWVDYEAYMKILKKLRELALRC